MNAVGHKSNGYCSSSVQKTETKTNTKNCGTNFSAVLKQSTAVSKPVTDSKGLPPPHHHGHKGHGGSHHGHTHSAHHGKHTHSHHGHAHFAHGKHTKPHFGHNAFHKGHSLLNSGKCHHHHTKPAASSSTNGTSGTAQAQKTLQLTIQSQTYMSMNFNSYSYSAANAVSANLNSLKAIGSYNFTSTAASASVPKTGTTGLSMTRTDRFYMGTNTLVAQHGYKISDLIDNKTGNLCPAKLKSAYQKHGLTKLFDGLQKEWELEYKVDMTYQIMMLAAMDAVKNKTDDDDSMLSFYKMLMKNFIENKSEGAVSLDDLYVENGKIMGLPPILDKIINSIQTAQSTDPDEKPDDAKSVLKEILTKGVKNIPDLTITIVMRKENEDNSSAEAA